MKGHIGNKQKLGGWGRGQKCQGFPDHHRVYILGLKWVPIHGLYLIFFCFFIINTIIEHGLCARHCTWCFIYIIFNLYVCRIKYLFQLCVPMLGSGGSGRLNSVQCHTVYKQWSLGDKSFYLWHWSPVPPSFITVPLGLEFYTRVSLPLCIILT